MFEYLKDNQIYSEFYQHATKAVEAWNAGDYKFHANECSLACLAGIKAYIKVFKVPCADANSVLFYINRSIFQSKITSKVKSAILYIEIIKDMANANNDSLTMNDLQGCLRNLDVFGTWLYQNLGEYANVPPIEESVVAPISEEPQVSPIIPVVQPVANTPVVVEKYKAIQAAKRYLECSPYSKKGLQEMLIFEKFSKEEAKYAVNNIETDWNKEALKAGERYLESIPYSKMGLYKMLVYVKFAKEEAQYAVDNIEADWNKEALRAGKQYLESISYSKMGLYKMLVYAKFAKEEAQYAVDNIEADWNNEALRAAKRYLESIPYSKKGLYKMLVFAKFTKEEAQYAVDNIEVNWKEEAVRAAKEYLDDSSCSKEELFEQLRYNSFNNEEARYAVNQIYKKN